MSANPQGKGAVPVLRDLGSVQSGQLPPKNLERVEGELFTSLFVLESDFSFMPVKGQGYHLYWMSHRFTLSLNAPGDWAVSSPGVHVGRCHLHQDLTWTLEIDPGVSAHPELIKKIEEKRRRLEERIRETENLLDLLPVHESGLPYHRRVMAYGLARSLGTSMELAGLIQLPPSEKNITAIGP